MSDNDTNTTSAQTPTTHFGFKQVEKNQKASMVAKVFDSVAAKYDVMNDLMSMGGHRLWKRYTIDCSGVRSGQKVLDIAGGTGDHARHLPTPSARLCYEHLVYGDDPWPCDRPDRRCNADGMVRLALFVLS